MDRFRVILLCAFLLISDVKISAISDTFAPGQSIKDGESALSADGSFGMGFLYGTIKHPLELLSGWPTEINH